MELRPLSASSTRLDRSRRCSPPIYPRRTGAGAASPRPQRHITEPPSLKMSQRGVQKKREGPCRKGMGRARASSPRRSVSFDASRSERWWRCSVATVKKAVRTQCPSRFTGRRRHVVDGASAVVARHLTALFRPLGAVIRAGASARREAGHLSRLSCACVLTGDADQGIDIR